MINKKFYWLPKTGTGKLAVILSVAFFGLFAFKALPVPLPSQFIFAIGFAGLIAEIIALVKKDWAILGVFPFLLGLLITAFVMAELAYPH